MARSSIATTPAESKDVINKLPSLDSIVFSPAERKCFDGIVLGVIIDNSMQPDQCQQ